MKKNIGIQKILQLFLLAITIGSNFVSYAGLFQIGSTYLIKTQVQHKSVVLDVGKAD